MQKSSNAHSSFTANKHCNKFLSPKLAKAYEVISSTFFSVHILFLKEFILSEESHLPLSTDLFRSQHTLFDLCNL